jgi:RimJ/RimL family protein N-acetyltransferase
MITFERSFDYELIRRILIHERIWPHITDDGSLAREEYKPAEHDAIWYVIVRDVREEGVDLLGLWMFTPQNAVCWEVHTALLPAAWGARGQLAARLLPEWIWANTPCRRIVTNVPETNRLALHFAAKAGMKVYGVNRQSWMKNGVLCDQICLGLSKAEAVAVIEEKIAS